MGKSYKLNKSELTRLKQEQKIYLQFLPVLKLKQEQLQIELIRIKRKYLSIKETYINKLKEISKNAAVLTDATSGHDILQILKPKTIHIIKKSIAGIYVPILKDVVFREYFINFFDAPCWITLIIFDLKLLIFKSIEIQVAQKQYNLINKELKKATQKVNLFEKVLIPNTKNAIKRINIILGDEQVAAVGRAKIAKNKTIRIN